MESIWLKQGRKLVGLSPEVAWPLMDSPGSGTFRFPENASGGAQAVPVLDDWQSLLRTQDQGSVSDSDTTDWDAGLDCDTATVSDCDTNEVQKLLRIAEAMAEALEDEKQILRAYTFRLYAMPLFPSGSSLEAQNAEVKALQKDVQVLAEARYALMELMDACAPWPGRVQVLHSKGLPAFHRIESMFALREMLNEQLSLCDKGFFLEVVAKGNISKLGGAEGNLREIPHHAWHATPNVGGY